MVTRTVEVPPERFPGWVERYAASHPGTRVVSAGGGLRLEAGAGATATVVPLLRYDAGPATAPDDLIAALAEHAAREVPTALLLVRRGGYAVGLACAGRLLTSKVGRRYVQSRTAAGGWSQQRFARRRAGQAHELVRAAAQAWTGLPSGPKAQVLVTGGDRSLVEELRAEPALRALRGLAVVRHLDVPDPRLTVLEDAARRCQALLVTVQEP